MTELASGLVRKGVRNMRRYRNHAHTKRTDIRHG